MVSIVALKIWGAKCEGGWEANRPRDVGGVCSVGKGAGCYRVSISSYSEGICRFGPRKRIFSTGTL